MPSGLAAQALALVPVPTRTPTTDPTCHTSLQIHQVNHSWEECCATGGWFMTQVHIDRCMHHASGPSCQYMAEDWR